jgi:transposase
VPGQIFSFFTNHFSQPFSDSWVIYIVIINPPFIWSAIIKVESENSPKYGRIGRHRKVRKMATYEKSFKEEAVKLSDEIGIKTAAAQMGVPYYTLADWRHRQNIHGDQAHVGSGHKRETGDEKDRRIRELERENAELARANEILQEALGFFAKNRKK